MKDWPAPFALHVESAQGARLRDVDGHEYIDFCLGDTGAMFGHAPPAVQHAVAKQLRRGITTMLPTEVAAWAGEALAHRFGLPYRQFALIASDANHFVIRWARAVTGRSTILVFNGRYRGTVDDVFVDLVDRKPVQQASPLGQGHDLTRFTRVVEFSDLPALELALQGGDVACVLAEPVMTNIGMVLPQPGYWAAAQEILKRHGTLLALDETHTIGSGPAGCARQHGNMLALAALGTTLDALMSDAAYAHMFNVARHLAEGLRAVIRRHDLPWCLTQGGARTECQFVPTHARRTRRRWFGTSMRH